MGVRFDPLLGELVLDGPFVDIASAQTITGVKSFASGLTATLTGFSGTDSVIKAVVDTSSASQPAALFKNNTNFAHAANILKVQMVNGTDSGDVVRIENGGTGLSLNIDDKMKVNRLGVILPVQAATASAPAYVKGGMYFDTTLNKMRIGGASAWETVTSV